MLLVAPDRLDVIGEREITGAPSIVVEVSSPSTYRHDRIRKRRAYEEAAVPEYWFVDLDDDHVEVYRLDGPRYASPTVVEPGAVVHTHLADVAVPVAEIVVQPTRD